MSVGYGDVATSGVTTMPPTIEWSEGRSDATAPDAIACAALPNANTQTRRARSMFRASTARAVAGPGAAAATAESYNSRRSSRPERTDDAVESALMRRPRRFDRLRDLGREVGVRFARQPVEL